MPGADLRPSSFASFNREMALDLLHRHGAVSRRELGEALGLSRTGVSSLVEQLVGDSLVEEVPGPRSGGRPGRPPRVLRPTAPPDAVLSLAVRPRQVEAALVSGDGRIVARAQRDVSLDAPAAQAIDVLARLTEEITAASQITARMATLTLPTLVHDDGRIDHLGARALMSSWLEIDTATVVRERWGLDVVVLNETVAAGVGALARHGGPAPRCALYVKVGASGTGMCTLVDGHPFGGASGIAGQLGHVSIRGRGVRCPCGQRGCIAAEIDAQVKEETERRRGGTQDYSVESLVLDAVHNDPATRRFFYDLGIQLAPALGAAINLLQPSLVVVGGDLADDDTGIMAGIEAELSLSVHPGVAAGLRIVASPVGPDASIIGAASLARTRARSAA